MTSPSSQVIPEAAVEAAVAAVARNYGSSGTPTNTVLWNRLVADVRTCLEAAAPYMEAAEYDRGFDDGHRAGQESMECGG